MKKITNWVVATMILAPLTIGTLSSCQDNNKNDAEEEKTTESTEPQESQESEENTPQEPVSEESIREKHLAKLGLDKVTEKVTFTPIDEKVNTYESNSSDENVKIKFKAYCLNDSLIVQEVLNAEEQKEYLIKHNYEVEIKITKDDKETKVKIHKELFKKELDKDFLAKSALSDIVTFESYDKNTEELIFKTSIGVPNTSNAMFFKFIVNNSGEVTFKEAMKHPGI